MRHEELEKDPSWLKLYAFLGEQHVVDPTTTTTCRELLERIRAEFELPPCAEISGTAPNTVLITLTWNTKHMYVEVDVCGVLINYLVIETLSDVSIEREDRLVQDAAAELRPFLRMFKNIREQNLARGDM